jgi:uncharacterized membrane protein YGL010W
MRTAMRTLTQWLGEYGSSHENPTNKLLHWICVPLIVLSLLGFLFVLPLPRPLTALTPWLNWGAVVACAALIYCLLLSPALTASIALAFGLMFVLLRALAMLSFPLWRACAVIFVVAWIGQFIGHALEGKRPSFFPDLQFLLIGPTWLVACLYQRLGIRY